MKYLILDLRGNAGGYLDQAVKIAARFIIDFIVLINLPYKANIVAKYN